MKNFWPKELFGKYGKHTLEPIFDKFALNKKWFFSK
jgi:hypothetical protein